MFAVIRYVVGFMRPVFHPACMELLFCSANLEACKSAMGIAIRQNGTFLAVVEYDPETKLVNTKPILHE